MQFCLPQEKEAHLREYCKGVLQTGVVSARELAQDGRDVVGNSASSTSSLATLSTAPEASYPVSQEVSLIRCQSEPGCRCKEGFGVVGPEHHHLEWSEHPSQTNRCQNGNGCFQGGLGSNLQRSKNRRTLVSSEKMPPHQLPGASGGGLRNEVLLEGSIQCSRSFENVQSNNSGIYKQDGGALICSV